MKTLIFLVLISLGLSVNAQLKVLSTGQVGIGIPSSATPLAPLHVGGSVYLPALGSYFINSTTDDGIRLRLHNNGVSSYIDFYPSVSFRTSNYPSSVNSTPLFLKYNAVGINNTDPSCALDVTGTIKTYGEVVNSDERLKDNIKDMTPSITLLSQLRGVTYTLKPYNSLEIKTGITAKTLTKTDSVSSASIPKLSVIDSAFFSRSHMGFLAQEVKNVYPDLVYADKNGILSVDYISLIPIIVESFKELDTRTSDYNALKQDLQDTKTKLAELEKRLDQCCGKPTLKSAQDIPSDGTTAQSPVLYQNVPNPFTQNTEISYYLPQAVKSATLFLYNMQGLQIKSIAINNRGNGKETINGSELKAGMYIYTLIADGKEVDTKRMILTQ